MSARKGILIASGIIVLGAAVAAVWWLFSSGRLVYVPSGNGNANTGVSVCDTGIVEEYNNTAGVNDEDVYTVNADQRKSIIDKVKSTNGYAEDPTCHAILYWYAISTKDKASAQEYYNSLVTLRKEGKYPDPGLNETASLRYYDIQIQSIDSSESPFGG